MDLCSSAISVVKASQTAGNSFSSVAPVMLKFSRPEEEVPLQTISLSLNLQLGLFLSTKIYSGSCADTPTILP